MEKQNLTHERVQDFSCPEKKAQFFLWDAKTTGFGIRATKNAKVFIHQGKLARKTIRIKIGDIRTLTLEDARKEARRLQTLIDAGIDPRQDKQDKIQKTIDRQEKENRLEVIFKEAWTAYLEDRRPQWSEIHYLDHLQVSQPGGEPYKRGKGKTKAGPLAVFMSEKLSDITAEKIESWLKKEAPKRGARARLSFSLLRAFLNWCENYTKKEYETLVSPYKGLVSPNVCSTQLKKKYIPKMTAKDDCLQKEQLPVWFKAVHGLTNKIISAYLQTLLLTGSRREELAMVKWTDIDFQWKSLTIHDKVENYRIIPLTAYVYFLLSNLPRQNQYVFYSQTAASGRIAEPRHAHNRAMIVAGIEDLTIHGLRRSFGTLSEWIECPVGVVAQIMGHKPSAIAEKHYRKRPLDLLRMWHVKIEKFILEEAGIEQPTYGQSDSNLKVVGGK